MPIQIGVQFSLEGMMLNSDRFLDAFNDIEKYLRQVTGARPGDSFSSSVYRAAKSDARVRRFRDALLEYAQLRNAIVHGPRGEHVLAEPNDQVTAEIERIAHLLTAPPGVQSFLRNRPVVTLQAGDRLEKALEILLQHRYAQVPVYRSGQFTGLLTPAGITRWLAEHLDTRDLRAVPVSEMLSYDEQDQRVMFMHQKESAFEVLAAFEQNQRSGKRLRAILVTDDGTQQGRLQGILTVWDLPEIYEALEQSSNGSSASR